MDQQVQHKEKDIPLVMSREEFVNAGYWLVDQIAEHFASIDQKPVTPGETPGQVRDALGVRSLPEKGLPATEILENALELVMEHSLFSGHPRFWGYIIGAGTQIGVLSDMLAASVNPNVGGWSLSPMATEIEKQAIQWIAEFIGYPNTAGGILVSGGAMANYVGFLVARRAQATWNIREAGVSAGNGPLRVYCSKETHTWVQKAADLFGLGTQSISWIRTDDTLRMDLQALEDAIKSDASKGFLPFLVVATAGTVSTGVVDDLTGIGELCKKYHLWYHIDGAYGGPAAGLPELKDKFEGISMADSIALDPHKWFYCPQEAGCILVRESSRLTDTFSYIPPYYYFEEYEDAPGINFYEYGMQNSRGFRALKVWTGFLQAGREGMQSMIRHDIEMAQLLHHLVREAEDFEPFQVNLSITTFRYKPSDRNMSESELNELNVRIMVALQNSGRAFLTNAFINGRFLLRACFVNFRTREEDVYSLPGILRQIAMHA
ncbi:MAG TPA: aspartate aminotransferase family protein [Saprospiraceae bacterium]|nr:aspartate aminotransferase family protein [Saprospiraceae bacterium]